MSKKAFLRSVLAPRVGAKFSNAGGDHQLDDDTMLLEVHDTHYEACELDVFLEMFGDVIPDKLPPQASKGIYTALANRYPNDEGDWRRQFDRWKAEGLIE